MTVPGPGHVPDAAAGDPLLKALVGRRVIRSVCRYFWPAAAWGRVEVVRS